MSSNKIVKSNYQKFMKLNSFCLTHLDDDLSMIEGLQMDLYLNSVDLVLRGKAKSKESLDAVNKMASIVTRF